MLIARHASLTRARARSRSTGRVNPGARLGVARGPTAGLRRTASCSMAAQPALQEPTMLSSNGEGNSFAAEEEIRQAREAGMDEDDLAMLRLEKEQGASNARRLDRRHLKKPSERHGAASNPLAVNSLLPMASPVSCRPSQFQQGSHRTVWGRSLRTRGPTQRSLSRRHRVWRRTNPLGAPPGSCPDAGKHATCLRALSPRGPFWKLVRSLFLWLLGGASLR